MKWGDIRKPLARRRMSDEPLKRGSDKKMHEDANPPTEFTDDEWLRSILANAHVARHGLGALLDRHEVGFEAVSDAGFDVRDAIFFTRPENPTLKRTDDQMMRKKKLSVKQVCDLLHEWGFAEYKASFEDNLIAGDILLSMDLETLEDLEVKLNHRRCLLSKIKRWSKKVIKPEVITIGDVVCLESDAKQSNCGLVLSSGHCVFEDQSVHLTKTLSLVKKKFDKKLDVGAVYNIIRKIGKPEEAKMFVDAKIGGEELLEVNAEWLGDIGITGKLRKRNLPISIKTELERMNKSRNDIVKKLKAISDEFEAKRLEAERKRLEAERRKKEAERKRLEAELEAEREAREEAELELEAQREAREEAELEAERERKKNETVYEYRQRHTGDFIRDHVESFYEVSSFWSCCFSDDENSIYCKERPFRRRFR